MNNVYVEATVKEDIVDTTAEKCNATACNIVWGSMNAAMVVENSFCGCTMMLSLLSRLACNTACAVVSAGLWFEHSAFAFYGGTGSRNCPGGPGTM